MAIVNTAYLKRRGFDLSSYDRSAHRLRVKCSQCQAAVINGVPCHESGCSNMRTGKRRWFGRERGQG